jgi:Domain of unknown function (DUF5104)
MKMKRFLFILISIILTFGLSSCSFLSGGVWSANDKKTAEDRFQQIMKAIDEKDAEGLKSMFSPNALKEAEDMDGGIAYLMGFIKGKIISTDVGYKVEETNDHGDKTYTIKCKTMVDATGNYILFFTDIIEDTKDPDNVGLYMIQVLKEPYTKAEFDWGTEIKCAGVYRPDIVQ